MVRCIDTQVQNIVLFFVPRCKKACLMCQTCVLNCMYVQDVACVAHLFRDGIDMLAIVGWEVSPTRGVASLRRHLGYTLYVCMYMCMCMYVLSKVLFYSVLVHAQRGLVCWFLPKKERKETSMWPLAAYVCMYDLDAYVCMYAGG
jgi:hypothetical protein